MRPTPLEFALDALELGAWLSAAWAGQPPWSDAGR